MTLAELFWTLLAAILIVGAGNVIGSFLGSFVSRLLGRTSLDPAVRRLLASLARPVVLFVAIMAALDQFGVDLTSLVAIAGAATLAIGMSLQGSLSNVASGAVLLTLRPLREGEFVTAGGKSGTVEAQGLFTTTLKTSQGVVVTLPNDMVLKAPIENFTRNGRRRIDINLKLEATSDFAVALTTLQEAAAGVEGILDDPAPASILVDVGPAGATALTTAWTTNDQFAAVRTELIQACLTAMKGNKKVSLTQSTVFSQA